MKQLLKWYYAVGSLHRKSLKRGKDDMLINATIILCLIGKFFKEEPIKKANNFVGYRTKRALANDHNWNLAQKTAFELMYKIFFIISTLLVPFVVIDILSLIGLLGDAIVIWSIIFQAVNIVVGFILIFLLTEKKLSSYGG